MNDKDINKLAAKLTKTLVTKDYLDEVVERLATKDDLKQLVTKKDLKRLEEKADGILELVENINEDHEKRLKRLEKQAPAVAT